MKSMKIYASILAADSLRLNTEIRRASNAGVDGLHVDVMDGHFVRDICFGPNMTRRIREVTSLPMDIHLMVEDPESFIDEYCRIGVDQITVHYRKGLDIPRLCSKVHAYGAAFCLAVCLEDPLDEIFALLDQVDAVLVIAVTVGIGGQRFNPAALERVAVISRAVRQRKRHIEISVDGGVNRACIGKLKLCGATAVVVGTALFRESEMDKTLVDFRIAADQKV